MNSHAKGKSPGKGKGRGGSVAARAASPRTPRTPRELLSQNALACDITKKVSHVLDACFLPMNNMMEQNSASADKVDMITKWLEEACQVVHELQESGQRLEEPNLGLVNTIASITNEFEELQRKADLWKRGDLPASSGIVREDTNDGVEVTDDDEEESEEEGNGDEVEESEVALGRHEEEKRALDEARRKEDENRLKLDEVLSAKRRREEDEETRKAAEESKKQFEEEQRKADEAKRSTHESREATNRKESEESRRRLESETLQTEEDRRRKIGESSTSQAAEREKDESLEKISRERVSSDSLEGGSRKSDLALSQGKDRKRSDTPSNHEPRGRQSKDDFSQQGLVEDGEVAQQQTEWLGMPGTFTMEATGLGANSIGHFPAEDGQLGPNPFNDSIVFDKELGKRRSRIDSDQPVMTRQISLGSDASKSSRLASKPLKKTVSKSGLPDPQWDQLEPNLAVDNDGSQDIRLARAWDSRPLAEDTAKKDSQRMKEKRKSKGESKKERASEQIAFKDDWPAPQAWQVWEAPPPQNGGNPLLEASGHPPPPPPMRTMSMGSVVKELSKDSFSIPAATSKDTLDAPNQTIVGGMPPAVLTQRPPKKYLSVPGGNSSKPGLAEPAPIGNSAKLPSERSGKIARLHIRRPYSEVAQDVEAFKAQFVRAASLAAGVPPHRIRVKSVRSS